ncbi:MAG TPA: hypothetical protein VF173_36165 [Thermoanaerobaculia bacterium]|nr:hypothetical protein [Thermoanaerobaculia bacterium]
MLTEKDLYDQGSKCCQQYSALTMQVRTMAQHVLIGYAVGMGIVLSRAPEVPERFLRPMGVAAGAVVLVFAFILWILNYHHSIAFRAIRDEVLVKLEESIQSNPLVETKDKPRGPWSAHKAERNTRKVLGFSASSLAWHFPFVALGGLGLAGMLLSFLM